MMKNSLLGKYITVVTDHYRPSPSRLRDWISSPKSSGYEALHITVMGPKGRWVEIQVRSERMDEIAVKRLRSTLQIQKRSNRRTRFGNLVEPIKRSTRKFSK